MEKNGAILSYQQLSGDKFPSKLISKKLYKTLNISTYRLYLKK